MTAPVAIRGLRCPCGDRLRCRRPTYTNGKVRRVRRCDTCGAEYLTEERIVQRLLLRSAMKGGI